MSASLRIPQRRPAPPVDTAFLVAELRRLQAEWEAILKQYLREDPDWEAAMNRDPDVCRGLGIAIVNLRGLLEAVGS